MAEQALVALGETRVNVRTPPPQLWRCFIEFFLSPCLAEKEHYEVTRRLRCSIIVRESSIVNLSVFVLPSASSAVAQATSTYGACSATGYSRQAAMDKQLLFEIFHHEQRQESITTSRRTYASGPAIGHYSPNSTSGEYLFMHIPQLSHPHVQLTESSSCAFLAK